MGALGRGFWGVAVRVAALVLVLAVCLMAFRWREEARRVRGRNQLNRIARAMAAYLSQQGGSRFYPPDLGVLVDVGLLSADLLVHPSDSDPPRLPNGLPCSYEYLVRPDAVGVAAGGVPPNEPLARERRVFAGGGRNVLFADSHVEFWTHTQQEPEGGRK